MNAPKFIAIWQHQWMLESGVERLETNNVLVIRAERLTKDFNKAAELGFERGIEEGARRLRQEIEDGEITITPRRSAA